MVLITSTAYCCSMYGKVCSCYHVNRDPIEKSTCGGIVGGFFKYKDGQIDQQNSSDFESVKANILVSS